MSILINNISDEEYNNLEGINFSKFKHFLDSPYHFKKNLTKEDDDEEKSALKIGLAVHCLSLQPQFFADKFAVSIDTDRRTNEGKRIWKEFCENNQGKTTLSAKEFDIVVNCCKAIDSNKFFNEIKKMPSTIFEAGGSAEIYGSKIKGRIDMFNPERNIVIDIKTCSEIPSVKNIRKAIYKNKYHMQAFFYGSIANAVTGTNPEFIFMFVDKKNFNTVGLAKIGPEFLNRAAEEINVALCRYENCKNLDVWPALENAETPYVVDTFDNPFDITPSDNEYLD